MGCALEADRIVDTQTALAAALGVSGARISHLKSAGRIRPMPDGRWNVAECERSIEATAAGLDNAGRRERNAAERAAAGEQNAAAGEELKPGYQRAYLNARALREQEEAARARIKRMAEEGALVDKAEVEREAFTFARAVRDAVLNTPRRIAPLLAPITDPFHLERMLTAALRDALQGVIAEEGANGVR